MKYLNSFVKRSGCLFLLFAFTMQVPITVNSATDCPIVDVSQTGGAVGGQRAALLINTEAGVSGWAQNEYRWFSFDTEGGGNVMLATALTAITTGIKVQMCPKIAGDFSSWSQIGQIYIIK